MTIAELRIKKANDMHVHLRQGDMLRNVLPHTALQCARALVMPNTIPPILTSDDLTAYKKSITEALHSSASDSSASDSSASDSLNDAGADHRFTPLMTFKVAPATSPDEVRKLKAAGAIAGKLYPEGVTTNSEGGVTDFKALYPVYAAMQDEGLVLCLHGEMPGVFSLDRESRFLETLRDIAGEFPKLKIVLEHATTADAINCVKDLPDNVASTLTVHHLYLTLDDVIGDKLNPHLFCKPIAKRPEDRDTLVAAALSGNPKFFLGSDSAPHPVAAKECECGAAGVYTAPVLLPALFQLFEKHDQLDRVEGFTSVFAENFYGLSANTSTIALRQETWTVAELYQGVKPFLAGTQLRWQVVPDRGCN